MSISPEAEALLRKNEATMLDLRSYTAQCWTTLTSSLPQSQQEHRRYECATLLAVKPNLMRYENWWLERNPQTQKLERIQLTPDYVFTCDGKESIRQYKNQYRTSSRVDPESQITLLEPWGGFFSSGGTLTARLSATQRTGGHVYTVALLPSEDVEGTPCNVIFYHFVTPHREASQEYQGRLFLSKDGLVRRKLEEVRVGDSPSFTRDAILRKVQTNIPAPPLSFFGYTPPSTVMPYENSSLS